MLRAVADGATLLNAFERVIAGDRWQDWGVVFTSSIDLPLEPSNVTHRLQAMLAAVRLPRQRLLDLRHCAASLLLRVA